MFFRHPEKEGFSFGIGAFIRIGQESQCLPYAEFFLQSVVAICCLPILELQFLQIKFNPIKLSCFINCAGKYFISDPLSCGKNIL